MTLDVQQPLHVLLAFQPPIIASFKIVKFITYACTVLNSVLPNLDKTQSASYEALLLYHRPSFE